MASFETAALNWLTAQLKSACPTTKRQAEIGSSSPSQPCAAEPIWNPLGRQYPKLNNFRRSPSVVGLTSVNVDLWDFSDTSASSGSFS